MKKIVFIVAMLFSYVYADNLSVMLSGLQVNYTEYDDNGNQLDQDTSGYSDMKGVKLEYLKNFNRFNISLSYEYNEGETKYDGQTWGGDKLYLTKKNSYLYNGRLNLEYLLTKDFTQLGEGGLYFVGGLGYRFWNRGKSDYDGDYDEEYKWAYYDFGLKININMGNFIYGITGVYQKAISPTLDAYFVSGTNEYDLGTTKGYKIEIPLVYKINPQFGIIAQYVYDYWKISKSNVVKNTYEPDSQTKNKYINFGIYYQY